MALYDEASSSSGPTLLEAKPTEFGDFATKVDEVKVDVEPGSGLSFCEARPSGIHSWHGHGHFHAVIYRNWAHHASAIHLVYAHFSSARVFHIYDKRTYTSFV